MDLLGYILIFFMGIILGLLGGGGSILTVPIFVYFFGISPVEATGNSLFVVGLTALIGSAMFVRKGLIDFKIGLIFAIPSIIGVNVSRGLIIPNIPDLIISFESFIISKQILIMVLFGVLMMAASYSMIKTSFQYKPIDASQFVRLLFIGPEGFIVGLIAGFVGAGGGFLIVPALTLLAGLPMAVAVGTSLMIIGLQSLFGFMGDILRGQIFDWRLLGSVAVIAVIGILVGSNGAKKIKELKLRAAFGWFVLFMETLILIEQARHILF